nr:T9SS type A sorting domain-containing protein [Pseudarcicella sp.]
ITDANGCTTTVTATITQPTSALTSTLTSQVDVLCFGGNNGSVVINSTGGTSPYSISPSTTGLTAGLKTFTITDANGCTTTVNATITEPVVALSSTLASQVDVLCFGGNNGSVTINTTGGTSPYSISPATTSLTAGAKTFTITDANGCTTTVSAIITEPAAALSSTLASQVNVLCFGGNNGSVTINTTGGTSPYSISPATTSLTAGAKTFTITDANGCTTTVNATITEPAAALSSTLASQVNVFCFGGNNGSVVINSTGGTSPYSISPSTTSLTAGAKTFTVTDANGCTTTVNATITEPVAALSSTLASQVDVLCFGGNNGSVTINTTGGTSPYSISPATTSLTAGAKTFTITDANGCTTTVNATITEPVAAPLPVIAGTYPVQCNTGSTIVLLGTPSGGSWSGAGVVSNSFDPNFGTQTLTYTFTDSFGCTQNDITTIVVQPCFSIAGTISDDVDGLLDATIDGSGIGLPNGDSLFVNLVDSVTNIVKAFSPVTNIGLYSFNNIFAGNYVLQLSTNKGVLNSLAPAKLIPSGWVYIGENVGLIAGNDGQVNGLLPIKVIASNVIDANFGIEQAPVSTVLSGGTYGNMSGSGAFTNVPQTSFSSNDPTFTGLVTGIRIVRYPANIDKIKVGNTVYFPADSNLLKALIISTNLLGQPNDSIQIDPVDGLVTVPIKFNSLDNAGIESLTNGVVNVQFLAGALAYNGVNFKGEKIENSVHLFWKTDVDNQVKTFVLEISKDSKTFEMIYFTNENQANSYFYSDNSNIEGDNYYRLKMTKADGNVFYSKIVYIKSQEEKVIYAYPNPASSFVQIKGIDFSTVESLVLVNMLGKEIRFNKGIDDKLYLNGIEEGTYILKVKIYGSKNIRTLKLIIVK